MNVAILPAPPEPTNWRPAIAEPFLLKSSRTNTMAGAPFDHCAPDGYSMLIMASSGSVEIYL